MLKFILVLREVKNLNYQNNNSKRKAASTPLRMKIILGVILALFLLLIGQLVYLQLIYGGRFQAEVKKTDQQVITNNVPRGVMYDSTGKLLVGNTANNAITYTKGSNVTTKDIYNISNRLSNYITLDEEPTKRQLYDYYLGNSKVAAQEQAKLPKSEREEGTDNSVITERIIRNLEKENLKFTAKQKTAALIFNKISGAYQLSTIYIKNKNLTTKEMAVVGEHLSELPGVSIGTDWSRSYPNGKSIQSIIGSVSSEKSGLPSDNLQYYLTQGYSRNDRVGTSYLEQKYEPLLKGTKSQSEVISKSSASSSSDGIGDTKTVYDGQSGASLILTLNSKYQQEVTNSLKKVYASAQAAGATQYSSGAYAVAMNPKTGALLAIAGLNHNVKTNKVTDDALGIINRSFVMGSVVKGAMVSGGLINKVITPTNNTLPDTAIYLPGSPVKKSIYPVGTFGSLDAPSALEVSSNIYMMHLAMNWLKAKYVPKSYISMPSDSFQVLRRNFAMFGLGQKTGVDLPGEVSGIQGATKDSQNRLLSGSALDLSYGNYDAYTPIQLVQYISTIANGGYRMKPYLVQSVGETNKEGNKVSILYNTKPTVQQQIPWTQAELNVVKQGLHQVVHGSNSWGTAHQLNNVKPSIAGKTGTAETFYYDEDNPGNKKAPELINATFVGYAPEKDPKLAIAIVFPGLDPDKEGTYTLQMAKEMVQDYFALNK